MRSLKTRHWKGNIQLHKHTRPAAVALCCSLTWLEHVLQKPTESCGIQHCKCPFVLAVLVGTFAPIGGKLLHGRHQSVWPTN